MCVMNCSFSLGSSDGGTYPCSILIHPVEVEARIHIRFPVEDYLFRVMRNIKAPKDSFAHLWNKLALLSRSQIQFCNRIQGST